MNLDGVMAQKIDIEYAEMCGDVPLGQYPPMDEMHLQILYFYRGLAIALNLRSAAMCHPCVAYMIGVKEQKRKKEMTQC